MDTNGRRTSYPHRANRANRTYLDNQTITHLCSESTGAGYDTPRWRKVTLRTTNGCSKRCFHPKNTASFKDRAAHGGGVRSNNQTSAYVRIEKEFFWFTENKNSLIYTKYTCIYMHQNICLYIIHVHTTDNVRPKQWPHALSNKLQVFYENLQVFYGI